MSAKTLCCSSNIRFAAAFLALAAFAACGKKASAPESVATTTTTTTTTTETAPVENSGPYGIKAGSYEMKLPMNMKNTVYFDDNGMKTATYTEMGGKTASIMLDNNDGFTLMCIAAMKSCTKTAKMAGSAPMPMSVPAVDRKALAGMELAGKQCEGWEVTAAGVTSKVWIYKGIPCKTEAAGQVMETTMISEEAPAAEKFATPAGYSIK